MAGLLDYGAGAGVGLENVLDRMLRERQVQQGSRRLDIEQQQGNRRLDLEQQRNQMEDALRRMQIDAAAENRKSQEQQRLEGEAIKASTLLGPGQEIDEPTAQRIAPTFLSSLVKREEPTQDQGPTQSGDEGSQFLSRIAPGRAIWMGTPAQREQQKQDEEMRLYMNDPNVPPAQRSFLKLRGLLPKGENPPSSPEFYGIDKEGAGTVHDTPQGLVRIQGGQAVPVTDEGGKRVQGFHAPPQPAISIMQTDQGLQRVDRKAGTATPVVGQGGSTLGPTAPAQQRLRENTAPKIAAHIDPMEDDIRQLDAEGQLGPMMGRWNDFLANKVGTTGDPDLDYRLGRVAFGMKGLISGFLNIHAGQRGAASAQLSQMWNSILNSNTMSKERLLGALEEERSWLNTYGPSGGGTQTPRGGTDPYQEYLNRKKKP